MNRAGGQFYVGKVFMRISHSTDKVYFFSLQAILNRDSLPGFTK